VTCWVSIMSTSADDDDSYLGQNFSIRRLLRVVKRKLNGVAFGGRFVWGSSVGNQPLLKPETCRVVTTLDETEVGRREMKDGL